MNLKFTTLLLFPAAILLLAGCGEASQPPVDIDATVEAKVEQALTAVPTATPYPKATLYFQPGVDYAKQGDYRKAIEQFNEAIRIDPQYAAAYYNRGWAYGNLGQYERAIQDFDEAIRIDPQLGRAYYNRGIAYQAMGKSEEAERDFAKVKELS